MNNSGAMNNKRLRAEGHEGLGFGTIATTARRVEEDGGMEVVSQTLSLEEWKVQSKWWKGVPRGLDQRFAGFGNWYLSSIDRFCEELTHT